MSETLKLPKPTGSSLTNYSKIVSIDEAKRHKYLFSNYLQKAKNGADLKMLFGNYLHLGEISVLAGRSGVGKSILAYQIAHCITTGESGLNQQNECEPMKLLYYDFELSEPNIKKRFYNYEPNSNFFRPNISEILIETDGVFNFDIVEKDIEMTGSKVVILDNISALSLKTTSEANETLQIMKSAKLLQMKKDITILLLAHTPKLQENKPLELYDISGSSVLHNFIDSAFMIGKSSKDVDIRYVKQVKSRNSYENDLVMTLQINSDNWLHYDFIGMDDESNLIETNSLLQTGKKDKYIEIASNIFSSQSLSYTEFVNKYADEYGKSIENGKKIFHQLNSLNLIIKDGDGRKYLLNKNENPF